MTDQAAVPAAETLRTVDLLIMSNMGRADGGRETWCYTMLPRWLALRPDIRLRLHYMHVEGQPDTRDELAKAFSGVSERFEPIRHTIARSRIPNSLLMAQRLRGWYRKRSHAAPDYSIAMVVAEAIFQRVIGKLRHRPQIVWLRTIYWDEKASHIPAWLHPIARRAEAWILRQATLLLANGDDIAAYYARYGLDVQVIRNGVELDRWAMPAPRFEGVIPIAYIGRLSDAKGIQSFLSLARMMRAAAPGRFAFHVCGVGPHEPAVRHHEAGGDIVWHGAVTADAMAETVAGFDICVAFTRASDSAGGGGTSNAMMEQMAAGRLLLAWDNRIFRQYLTQDNALLVPQDDVDAAARALLSLDPADMARRAAAGRETIAAYGIDRQLARFDEAVSKAAERSSSIPV